MPHDDEGYTCVLVGTERDGLRWQIVDRYGVAQIGESTHVKYAPARLQAEKLNAAVLAARFTP